MKDIVIVSNFATLTSENANCRFHDIAERLCKHAKVEIVLSSFYHAGKCQRNKQSEHADYMETFIDEPGYPKNVCLRRFYSHYKWGKGVIKYMRQRKKPDVVYCAVPSLTAAGELAKYCKEENIRFVIDIQDLWPEAFEMVLPVPFVFDPMRKQADRIYSQADLVVAVSKTYAKRAMSVNTKSADEIVAFLGSSFDENNKPVHKPHAGINVVYIGTVGASYDIRCMVDALKACADRGYTDVKGYVVGDGPELDSVKQYAAEKGVPMEFTGRLPYTEMMKILEICDIAINPIRHRAAQSIINKVGDYAISGLPVVSSQENEEYRKLVDEWHIGYNCKNSNSEDMAEKIMLLCDKPDERRIMGDNNRKLAESKFNRNKTYPKIVEKVLEL